MFQEVSKHLSHYFNLLGIIFVAFWGLLIFPYDQVFQSVIAIALGLSFVIWGLIHHLIHEDLHPKIVLEYIATAVFGVVILLLIIWKV